MKVQRNKQKYVQLAVREKKLKILGVQDKHPSLVWSFHTNLSSPFPLG